MYSIIFSSSSKKDLKKLPQEMVIIIKEKCLSQLVTNPYFGEKLHGVLKNFWKLKVKSKGVDYRVIYKIYKNKLVVLVVLVGTRENIYQELNRRIR